ncbi:MAG TPA: shikimate dehydrogenase, partial [Lachnospiraceae bacterium]|nr:shikimate dehydrogenase [Lachnospiraceae bacterium]
MAERIDGKTKLYGLIGHPVAHTFSPFIHNRLGELTGLNLRYVPFDVTDPDMIGAAVKGAFALNIQGMNVTVPYKQAVMP